MKSFYVILHRSFFIFFTTPDEEILFTFYFLLFTFYSQTNLVPNPSFEAYSNCPTSVGQIYYATPWFQPIANSNGSTDYYNACTSSPSVDVPVNNYSGHQYAHSGTAYAGFAAYIPGGQSREYLEVELLSTLITGKKYCIEFHLSLADTCKKAVSNIGIYFSNDSLLSDNDYVLNYPPQVENAANNIITDKIGWTLVSGSFIAAGEEKFLTIGNFRANSNTNSQDIGGTLNLSYYYIDDISVIEGAAAQAGQDTTICKGDSIMLGIATDTSISYSWLPNNSLSNLTVAQPIASPTVTTTYYLTINTGSPCKGNLTDSVTVTVINCDTLTANNIYIPNAFSPNGDGVNDTLQVKVKGAENISYFSFTVYNRWGEEVFKTNDITKGWDGMYMNAEAPEGVYVYFYSAVLNTEEPEIKKGNVTLIR